MTRSAERRRAKERNRRFIRDLKIIKGCKDCGFRDDPDRLHFDHLPGTEKKANVSQMLRWGRAGILAEIEKCEARLRQLPPRPRGRARRASG